jgi:hypothetical protein
MPQGNAQAWNSNVKLNFTAQPKQAQAERKQRSGCNPRSHGAGGFTRRNQPMLPLVELFNDGRVGIPGAKSRTSGDAP